MNEFGKFVRSPFYNESEKMIKLYDLIRKYYPEFNDINFTKENVYKELYGSGKYEDKKIRDRFSDMLKLAEEYLSILNFKKNKFMFKKCSLDELLDRDLHVHFEKKYKETKKILAERKLAEDEEYFFHEYILSIAYNAFNQYKHPLGKKNNYFDDVAVELDSLIKYFVMETMRYYAFANHLKKFVNIDFNYDFYNEVMSYIEKNDMRKYPLVSALWIILKIHEKNTEDESLYHELKRLYLDNYKLFVEKDKIMILTELYNFTHVRSMIPETGFSKERFEIIKLQIEHNVYAKQDGWMQREQYTTVINAASLVKEFDWMEKFIENYTGKVVPELREDSCHWAKASLYYSRKKYEEALTEIGKTKNGDYIFYVNTRTLLIKVLFELEEYEQILTIIDSFKHFVNSSTFIPDYIKERNLNFLSFSQKTVTLYMNIEKDEFKISKLLNEIKNIPSNQLLNQLWLIDKLRNKLTTGSQKNKPSLKQKETALQN